MDPEKWLEQVKKLDELIDAKIAERERLIDLAEDVSPKPIDGMPYTDTGMVSKKMENAVISLVMLADEINKLIDKYVDCKRQITMTLEKLPEKEYGVLHRHYIRYMPWEEVAEDMGYSTTHIWRIKRKALEMLLNVMPKSDIMYHVK